MDCKECKARFRADKLVEDDGCDTAGAMSDDELIKYIYDKLFIYYTSS